MTTVRCVEGSVLEVRPVPVLGRDGVPYEVSLVLLLNAEPFGAVGERCGYFLAATAARLRAARAAGQLFPTSSLEAGVRAHAEDRGIDADHSWRDVVRYLPRDRELFSFHARDPDDLTAVGELRARLVEERVWSEAGWVLRSTTLLEAWGTDGTGVRALLSSDQLLAFLEDLVQEFAAVGAAYAADEDAARLRRPVG